MSEPPFTPIIKEGWLLKEGHIIKSWKRRWFVLGKGIVKYFEKKYKGEKGSFQITGDTVISTGRGPKGEPALYIKNPEKAFYIVCEQEVEVVCWINAFNRVIEACKNNTLDQLGSPNEIVNQFTNAVFKKEMLVPEYKEGALEGMFNPIPHCPITQQQIFQLPNKLNQAFRLYVDLDYSCTQIISKSTNFMRSVCSSNTGLPEKDYEFSYDKFYQLSQHISELIENIHASDFTELKNPDVSALIKDFGIADFIEKMNCDQMEFETPLNQWIYSADKMHSMYDDLRYQTDPADGVILLNNQMESFLEQIDSLAPDTVTPTFDIGSYLLEKFPARIFKDHIQSKTTYAKVLSIFKSFNLLQKELDEAAKRSDKNEDANKYFVSRHGIMNKFNSQLIKHLAKFTFNCKPSDSDRDALIKDFDEVEKSSVTDVSYLQEYFQ
ncbi:PH domain containing protein [Trichomonas vaginalis G3]|uniref:PH domain containing protein n=1 Tax=Trichomonas vaginalis (strain ATCC PRA-98 / G3) TaxID=412133 RepID=A2F3V7_TRIV3|nr:pleckstrin family [Trichomonas vaginalis G3]EAY00426.1 PH domain containing protein [Trichomonas vaginalis G3]KAI5526567.1 pleckstrin family [Trichomonas vaginalis G3]|eukprot:XP_001313355.1 PH domain containing protein [Trichomonas vaginalis G3]